jgi:hypothetical protein
LQTDATAAAIELLQQFAMDFKSRQKHEDDVSIKAQGFYHQQASKLRRSPPTSIEAEKEARGGGFGSSAYEGTSAVHSIQGISKGVLALSSFSSWCHHPCSFD